MKTKSNRREIRDGTLTLRVSEDESACTLALAGELDMANAETLAAALERAESTPGAALRIDLSELEFIDSTGIALLVSTHRQLDGSDRLSLVPSQATAVQRVMALTGLDAELPFTAQNGAASGA